MKCRAYKAISHFISRMLHRTWPGGGVREGWSTCSSLLGCDWLRHDSIVLFGHSSQAVSGSTSGSLV